MKILTLTFIAVTALGCSRTPAKEGAVTHAESPVAVTTTMVNDGDIGSTFEAGGVVRARATATLAARVMAPVLTVSVKAGDRVSRGSTLITLDAREMAAQVARGSASVTAADEAARASQSQSAAAEANVTLARATYDRIKGLHSRQSATAQELDQATAALAAADAQLAGARAQSLAAAASRDAARAGADAATIGLSYTTLTAPFDGIVASRTVDPGSLAAPGMPLLVLEQSGPTRLDVSLDEARAGRVVVGQAVEVQADGAAGHWLSATVTEVGRTDPSTHSFIVKIDLPADTDVRTGTFGRARFALPARRGLTVPATSLVRRGQLAFVFIADQEAHARLRPVTPGPTADDERVEILAGLTAGERILVSPPPSLRDGTPVTAAAAGGR